ncbi:M15 family metallopeptidase [Asanoa sp. NPDC050611]|uniref:M15 family metallopeptidase n=1 Tax=Asanoa sp. NPDC050611 TaxID=3157098 RepID=UPI0033EAE95A
MVELPIKRIEVFPRELSGHFDENGRLPRAVLVVQPGSAPKLTMCRTAMRSLEAMAAEARKAIGLRLRVGFSNDSYRPLNVQERLFRERYQRGPGPDSAFWDSDGDGVKERWSKKDPDLATAAVPGTSNHGLGLACDFVLDSGDRILTWLIKHADEFGFSAELQKEPWHWHYHAGDAIPAATRAYEEDEMAYTEGQMRAFAWQYNGRGLANNDQNPDGNISALGAFNEILLTVRKIATKVDLSPAELAAIREASKQGAQAGFAASVDDLVEAVLAALPQGDFTAADVEAAVRSVAEQNQPA